MMQDKIKPELSGQPSTRMSGIFSTFHRLVPTGRWGAWIVLSAALLLTFTAWYFFRDEVIKRAQTRFNFRVKTIETGIFERLQAYEFLLQGGGGLFSISNEVTRKDWRTYVNSLQIDQYYPGIQGVGFSKRILPSEMAAHIRQIRGEGFPQYTIYPDGERAEYTSIIFLEPFDWRNKRAFGYDMFSQATRKEAMIRARDTGKAALSGKITLVQETDKDIQSGFLIYQAIYRKGEPQETPEQRRKTLLGYVYSPFRMNDFMKGILAEKEGYVDLQVFDGDKPLKETLLYQSDNAEESHNHPEGRHFAASQVVLEYANHSWLLSFVSSKYFEENISSGGSNFILVLGLTISILLFGMVLSLSKSRSQAIALANTTVDLKKANIGLKKEIMEREQVEESLRQSENKLRLTLDATPFPVAVVDDQDDKISYWSRSASELFGHTPSTASEWYKVAYPDSDYRNERIKRWKPYLEIARESKLPVNTGESEISCKDGTIRTCELYATFIPENLIITFNDITEPKQAIEALRKSEENYKALAENPNIIVMRFDPKGHILFVNQYACQLFGYSFKEMMGKKPTDLILPEIQDDGQRAEDLFANFLNHPERFQTNENANLTKDGKLLWISWANTPTYDESGQLTGLICTGFDTTDKKHMEKQLLQAQKMESIGTLAGGIAHDFNNILSSIIGFSELALDGVDEGSEVEDDLQEVRKAGLRAKDLVKQILTFARQSDEVVMPIQVNIIAKEVIKFIKSSIPTSIQIKNKIISDSLIMGSPTQIHQILMNLCTNAAHAMEENGGILELSVNDTTIDRTAMIPDLRPGEYIEIKVTDTGMGISPQIIHTIFEPYFTTKPVGEGTGMGLAVVHGIVENYGGKITVDSTIGKGTCFTIYLPITKKRKVHINAVKEDLPLGNENILFVDDEAPIAKMGSKVLEQLGYSVTSRTSSVEALELFRSKPQAFDLVVTDMTMPNLTGDKLAIELMKVRSDIPVILCTGYSKKISEESAAKIGIKAFAYKPIVKADLAKAVRKVLDETKSSE